MAIRDRSTKIVYTNELNVDGVATQKELTDQFSSHLTDYHVGGMIRVDDGMEFFYDITLNKWLSTDWYSMNFFSTSTSARNLYLNTVSAIASNLVPFRLPFNYSFLISKLQLDVGTAINNNNLFKIESESGTLLTTFGTTSSTIKFVAENLNIVVPARTGIRVYNNATSTRRPVVTVWVRLIRP